MRHIHHFPFSISHFRRQTGHAATVSKMSDNEIPTNASSEPSSLILAGALSGFVEALVVQSFGLQYLAGVFFFLTLKMLL